MGPLDLDLIIKLSVLLYLGSSNLKMFKIAIFFCVFSLMEWHNKNENNSIDAFAYVRIVEPD